MEHSSCSLCRRRKIRCNRETPCSNCVKSRDGICVYEEFPSHSPRQRLAHARSTETTLPQDPEHDAHVDTQSSISVASTIPSRAPTSIVASSTSGSTPASQPYVRDVESMRSRIKELEHQLSKVTPKTTSSPAQTSVSNVEITTSGLAGTFYFHHDSRLFGQAQVMSRSVMHKTRVFGQSHWMNGAAWVKDILEAIEPHIHAETSKVSSGIQRCKSLARIIKSQRAPPWPSPPTTELPPKDIADELVECYLRTTEKIYRILHVPSFRRDYEALWLPGAKFDTAFLVQLKLVLAIGATTYDEQFSMRASAVQWVYEAHTWLSEPEFKSRLSIQTLQTNLLLLIARETAGVGADLIWVSTGAVIRTAMYMGLHKDPAFLPKRSIFAAEMRRRLWNTILELSLQTSILAGGSPLVSLDDYNAEAPGNFDDEQLLMECPVPKAESEYTQVSMAVALRKTFSVRLAITKFLNDLGSQNSYEEALRLDTELKASYKSVNRTLQVYELNGRSPSRFEIRMVDFLIRRYHLSLHISFFGLALHDAAYAFSRKVVIDTALNIWCTAYPSSSVVTANSHIDIATSDRDDVTRLTTCGSGFFRIVPMQACIVIYLEIKAQLQEEESLGPVPLRPDLLSAVNDAKAWSMRCIEAGETNIKGYLLICVLNAQVEGLRRGMSRKELSEVMVKAAEDAEDVCLPILEAMVAQGQVGEAVDALDQIPMISPPEQMEDWDFMTSDAQFHFGNVEPMSWMFSDGEGQGPPLW